MIINELSVVTYGYQQVIHIVWIYQYHVVRLRMAKIYDTDTVRDISKKIFDMFEIHESCRVSGFVMDSKAKKLVPKGELVMKEIEFLDDLMNCRFVTIRGNKGDKEKKIRNYKFKDKSVGGPISHKIFTFEVKVSNNEPVYTIWRYQ